MQHEYTVNRVPQCDPLGYESESYETVLIEVDDTAYTFPNLVIVEWPDKILVGQNMNDHELRYADSTDLSGVVKLDGTAGECLRNLALATWLLTSPEGKDFYCEVA